MKLGIDARMFGARVGGGGIGRYVAELVTHLQEIDGDTEYVIFLKKENFHEFVIKRPNFSKRLVDIPWYSWREQREMPGEILRSRVRAMHYPHWNVPLWSKVPFVVTLHDVMLLENEQARQATTRNPLVHAVKFAAFRHVLEHAVYKSRHIIAVSQTTKESILRHFRVPAQKISVVYQGVRLLPEGKHVELSELGVQGPYVLAVGNMYPHKNHWVLVEALRQLDDMPSINLVFAGKYDAFTEALQRRVRRLGLDERVRFVHAPTDHELAALYKGAALVAHPSLAEGFGIPPLEAALAHAPVAVSDLPIFHETLGEGVQYVSAEDPAAWAVVIRHAVDVPQAWGEMVTHSARTAKRYNWSACAQEMKELYLRQAFPRL